MIESNKKMCKICSQLKDRIEDGKYKNSKNKRFIDTEGRLWSGRVCPDCQVTRTRENMKKLRFIRKLGTTNNEDPPTTT